MFEQVFTELDTSIEAEGLELIKCEPNYNIWFGDGKHFELSTDIARMKSEIERWEGKDGFERYLAYLQEAHRHYELSVTHVLQQNFTSLWSMARPSFLRWLFALHPFESIYSRASRYFLTERLRRVFTFGSMYMGMSPFDAPGTYSLLQYTELAEGIWYPKGGFHRVLQALIKVGERLGVDYQLSSTVTRVIVDSNGNATGISLEGGKILNADVVLINADLVYAYNNLLPKSAKAKSLSKKPGSCSSISFYWAMDRTIPELYTHNVFLAEEYRDSFDDIFKRQQIPKEPSFYVNVPSRVDATAAPPGKDSIVVLVPTGHLLEDQADKGLKADSPQDWEAMISKAREAVFTTIKTRTGANIRDHVVAEKINTPASWKEKFNLDKGAILGLSHSFFNVLSFRPSTKHARIKNLYFVGASTHPGTGVPIVLAGSKITTEQILRDRGVVAPWRKRVGTGKGMNELDRIGGVPYDLKNSLAVILTCLVLSMLFWVYMPQRLL